jgi:hypothetical protein
VEIVDHDHERLSVGCSLKQPGHSVEESKSGRLWIVARKRERWPWGMAGTLRK